MAHVAATSNRLPAMSAHIWQSQPSQSSDTSNKDSSATVDLPVTSSVPNPSHVQPSLWQSRSPSPPLVDHVSSTPASSPIPMRRSPAASTPEIDLSHDADAVFRNLLNLRIDGHPALTRSASAHSTPFQPPQSNHPSVLHPRLASSSMHDLRPDQQAHANPHHRSLLPATTTAPSSMLMSLHGLPLHTHGPAYHPSVTPIGHDGQNPSRGAHTLRQSSATPAAHVSGPVSASPMPPPNPSGTPRIKNELYKTEICRSFAETGGFCKYGAKCQFAHGDVELRPVRRHPRYKTKLCRNFVTTGSCPYDARCRFIHASDLPMVQNGVSSGLPAGNSSAVGASTQAAVAHHNHNHFLQQLQHQQQLREQAQQMHPSEPLHSINVRDKYSDNMRSFFPLPASSPPPAHHLDNFGDALKAELRSTPPISDLQTDKLHHPVMPTDQVYHANANVFHDYQDNNAFHHTFMHLSGTDSGLRFPSSEFSDRERDPVLTAQHVPTSTVNVIGVGPQKDPSVAGFSGVSAQRESLFSHPPASTNMRSVSPPASSASSRSPGSNPIRVVDSLESGTLAATSSTSAVLSDPMTSASGHVVRGDIENDKPAANRFSVPDAQRESLFSHSPANKRSLSPSSSTAPSNLPQFDEPKDPLESTPRGTASASPLPRSRLPVFRNMASDLDEA